MIPKNQFRQLKREQFAQSIRQKAKQAHRLKVRQNLLKRQQDLYDGLLFDHQHFAKIKQFCYHQKFSQYSVSQTVKYLCFDIQLVSLAEEKTINFLIEISKNMGPKSEIPGSWQSKIYEQIQGGISKILKHQIARQQQAVDLNQQNKKAFTRQISQLPLLSQCFAPILTLCCDFFQYMHIWTDLSAIENQEFNKYVYKHFENLMTKIIGSLEEDHIQIVLTTLHNFMGCEGMEENDKNSIIYILDELLMTYYLSEYAMKLLLQIMMEWMNRQKSKYDNIDFKVNLLADETKLLQNIVVYLDRTETEYKDTSPNLVGKISNFIAKVFCADDETCMKAYFSIMMVVEILRSWLPAEKNITKLKLEQSYRGHTIHSNHLCTKSIFYALSNIVATDCSFVEIFLKTDIYNTFIYLFPLLPEKCREEISACIYSMVFKSNYICLNIMLETKLPEILNEMLKERSQQILERALEMMILIYNSLREPSIGIEQQSLFDSQKLIQYFERIGIMTECQKMVFHENKRIGDLINRVLSLFQKERSPWP